jgi:ribosomal protein S18 acetylase RimI-like enzyme
VSAAAPDPIVTGDGVDVRPATAAELPDLLPLIAEYQRFYGAEPDEARNREFFRRFVEPSDLGLLLGAWADGTAVGFACLYWTHSSVSAIDVALLNDILVSATTRSRGVGRLLLEAAAHHAAARGYDRLVWQTAPDNERAQRLYDQLPASRSPWLEYSLPLPLVPPAGL